MNITSTTLFSILLNGAPTRTFKPSRDIRQGDPLSPFMFILMAEGLGRVIKDKIANRELRGLKLHICSKTISHQQFVDDTMLMGHSLVQEERVLKNCLSSFSRDSGIEVNNTNSQVFFFNTPRVHQKNILHILGFQGSSLPSKYHGAPLVEGVIRKVSWEYLLDRMRRKLENWAFRPHNMASRVVLVKIVLQAMPIYLFSTLSAPKLVLKQVREIQINFLWGGNHGSHGWALVSWDTTCKRKDHEV